MSWPGNVVVNNLKRDRKLLHQCHNHLSQNHALIRLNLNTIDHTVLTVRTLINVSVNLSLRNCSFIHNGLSSLARGVLRNHFCCRASSKPNAVLFFLNCEAFAPDSARNSPGSTYSPPEVQGDRRGVQFCEPCGNSFGCSDGNAIDGKST